VLSVTVFCIYTALTVVEIAGHATVSSILSCPGHYTLENVFPEMRKVTGYGTHLFEMSELNIFVKQVISSVSPSRRN
jgi:hypothetical protein